MSVPSDAVRARLRDLAVAVAAGDVPDDDALRDGLREALHGAIPRARSVLDVTEPLPDPVLSLAGQSGALVSVGCVGILAGAGGLGKSALAGGLAVDVAVGLGDGPLTAARRGAVLVVTFEDAAAVTAWRVREYAAARGVEAAAVRDVHVLALDSPIFGPVGPAASYNARPGRLPAWAAVESAVRDCGPVLTVIDPALAAFAGESNAPSPTREFLMAVASLAGDGAVLLAAHSTKAARRRGGSDRFDPGLVGGTTHWCDGVRGVLALDWRPELPTERDLACVKANHGPGRLVCGVRAVRASAGAIVGFTSSGEWYAPRVEGDAKGGDESAARSYLHAGKATEAAAVHNVARAAAGVSGRFGRPAPGLAKLAGAVEGAAEYLQGAAVRMAGSTAAGDVSALALGLEAAIEDAAHARPLALRAAVNRHPAPILPARLAMVGPDAPADRLRLFPPARHATSEAGWLPGFGSGCRDPEGPALPLALYDLGGGAAGPGPAPLALRMFVEAVLAAGDKGAADGPVELPVTLREFLTWFYAGTGRTPRPAEYWPALNRAAEALDAREVRIPWEDPATGRGGRRRVVSVLDIPRGPGRLDDVVSVVVNLPPGCTTGPAVDRARLREWGRRSGAAYRALLNLSYRWWRPGITRIPAGGRGRGRKHWLQVQDAARYEHMSGRRLVELVYPTAADRDMRQLERRAWRVLERLAKAGDVRLDGRRVLPPKPAPGATRVTPESTGGRSSTVGS